MSGDGRADYTIRDGLGGLTGYLNVYGPKEIPIWIDQGPDKWIALAVSQASPIGLYEGAAPVAFGRSCLDKLTIIGRG